MEEAKMKSLFLVMSVWQKNNYWPLNPIFILLGRKTFYTNYVRECNIAPYIIRPDCMLKNL